MNMDEMPEFKPSSLDQRVERALAPRKRPHFSYADWDFQNVDWTLDESIYKAAPPSLHGTGFGAALVKHATTGALSDGRFITWARSSLATSILDIFFRNQVADGTSDYDDGYIMTFRDTELQFRKGVGGVTTTIDTHAMTWTWSTNTWYKIRVTWWTSVDRIYVRVERWNGDSWVLLGGDADTDFEDTDDLWKDNPVNRTGIYYITTRWNDDVEVWGV